MGKPRRDPSAKIPDFTQPQWIHFDKMTGRKVNEYMLSSGHHRAKDVIAELVTVALSHNPSEAIDGFMRKKAFDQTRVWLMNSFYGWLEEMQKAMQKGMNEMGFQRLADGSLVPFTGEADGSQKQS